MNIKQKTLYAIVIVFATFSNFAFCMDHPIPEGWCRVESAIDFGKIPAPEKGSTNHASTGAISFFAGGVTSYICSFNFVACASGSKPSSHLPSTSVPCLARTSSGTTPRLDSEPAFLEYITGSADPVTVGIQISSPLGIMLTHHEGKRFTIILYINNSDYAPCKSGTRPGKPCDQYLQDFCNKFKCTIEVKWPNGSKKYTPK